MAGGEAIVAEGEVIDSEGDRSTVGGGADAGGPIEGEKRVRLASSRSIYSGGVLAFFFLLFRFGFLTGWTDRVGSAGASSGFVARSSISFLTAAIERASQTWGAGVDHISFVNGKYYKETYEKMPLYIQQRALHFPAQTSG